jgi:isopentenyl-diphosphate delta-isomerase
MTELTDVDDVVLLDLDGTPIGTAAKAAVHGPDTPLHLAFSCYVLNTDGEVLVTRRALTKRAWPGVWSNSFCGHPQPTETLVAAVHRRADFEIGVQLTDVELALPVFRYRATDSAGIVENEVCPVYVASMRGRVTPHPGEVMDHAWVDPAELGRSVRATPWAFSPWLVLQAQLLPLLGGSLDSTTAAHPESSHEVLR